MVLSPNTATVAMAHAYQKIESAQQKAQKRNLGKDFEDWGNHAGEEHLGYLGLVPNPKTRKRSGESAPGPKSKKMKMASSNGLLSIASSHHGVKICSLACTGASVKGTDATLPCGTCQTLYHPECVGFDASKESAMFICRKCIGSAKLKAGPACSKKQETSPNKPSNKSASAHIVRRDGNNVVVKIYERLVQVPQNALVQTESGPKVMMSKQLLKRVMESAQNDPVGEGQGSVLELSASKAGPKSSKEKNKSPDKDNETFAKSSKVGPKSFKVKTLTEDFETNTSAALTKVKAGPKSSKAGPKSSKTTVSESKLQACSDEVQISSAKKAGPASSKVSKVSPKSSKSSEN